MELNGVLIADTFAEVFPMTATNEGDQLGPHHIRLPQWGR